MSKSKHYPKKRNNYDPTTRNTIARSVAGVNRHRYKKGYLNNMTNATRRTETYTKDKVVIVTESVNVVDFNSDDFNYQFGDSNQQAKRHYKKKRGNHDKQSRPKYNKW